MTLQKAKERAELRRLLERASSVDYDVEQGLARHRVLVEAGTPPPDWAHEVDQTLPYPRKRFWLLGSLSVLTLGAISFVARSPESDTQPAPLAHAHVASHREDQPPPLTPEVTSLRAVHNTAVSEQAAPQKSADTPATASAPIALDPTQPAPAAQKPEASARAKPAMLPSKRSQRATVSPSTQPASVETAVSSELATLDLSSVIHPPAPARRASEANKAGPENASAAPPELAAEQPEVLAEMEQLAQAERALKTQPERTLALVRAGFERFRPGYLQQERRYLEVMALFQLGKDADARLLGRMFLRDYASGPYRLRVEQALRRP